MDKRIELDRDLDTVDFTDKVLTIEGYDEKYMIAINGDIRLYYKPNEDFDGAGFQFKTLECRDWSDDNEGVRHVLSGVASFEGLKHTNYGDGNGYLPNVDPNAHRLIWGVVNDLECMFCRDKMR